jgi:hypothetical protein
MELGSLKPPSTSGYSRELAAVPVPDAGLRRYHENKQRYVVLNTACAVARFGFFRGHSPDNWNDLPRHGGRCQGSLTAWRRAKRGLDPAQASAMLCYPGNVISVKLAEHASPGSPRLRPPSVSGFVGTWLGLPF